MIRQKDYLKTLDDFAKMIQEVSESDRDVTIACGGFTGEGKSCFLTKLFQAHNNYVKDRAKWTFELMTWSRKELLKWIDGEGQGRKGRLPEGSCILVDELFMLFYKRNWYEEGQIDAIGTLNMCRDRHLLIGGNIPNFWDLDTAFQNRIRFYCYIPQRGIAWVFEQENNPFTIDPWNRLKNEKGFRKFKKPYLMSNFLCEIRYPDWTPAEKDLYYSIRNEKRHLALESNKKENPERYKKIKEQRNIAIRWMFNMDKKLKVVDVAKGLSMDNSTISRIKDGITI